MERKVGDSTFEKQLIPEGYHLGICFQIVDLGSKDRFNKFENKMDPFREIRISFEVPSHRATYNPEKGEQVMAHHIRNVRLSFGLKSNLMGKILGPWRNVKYKESDKVDLEQFIGQAAMLTISHSPDKDGNLWENAVLSHVPKGERDKLIEDGTLVKDEKWGYKTENRKRFIELDDFQQDRFDDLDEWVKDRISESPEFQGLVSDGTAKPHTPKDKDTVQPKQAAPTPATAVETEEDDDDGVF